MVGSGYPVQGTSKRVEVPPFGILKVSIRWFESAKRTRRPHSTLESVMPNIVQAKAAIDAFVLTQNTAVAVFRQSMVDAGFVSAEDCKPVIMQWVSKKYACPIVVSTSNRNKGQDVLDRTSPNWVNADKAFKRLMDDLTGDADKAKSPKTEGAAEEAEEIEIPADILAAAAKLAKLCDEYKGARKLASKALAVAFAK